MKLQVLVSTMYQKDYSLLERMNIHSDVIVINQCDYNKVERFTFRGYDVLWMSFNERGVGVSRNNALLRASGDILLFADDDVVYEDDYSQRIIGCFENNPTVDFIVFNLKSLNPERPEAVVDKTYKLHWYNCMKFGACKIAIRKDEIRKANVYFSLLFGGGAQYQAGEDSLFIIQCLKQKMSALASTELIGTVRQESSSWFKGFDEKFFFDKGVLMKQCFGIWAKALLVVLLVKNAKWSRQLGLKRAITASFKGVESI